MAVLTGVNGELLINGITVAKCRSFSLNQQRDAIEVTPLGDEWRTYVSGLKGATGSASVLRHFRFSTKLLLGNLVNNSEHTVTLFNRGGSEEWAYRFITSVGASASVGDASACEVSFGGLWRSPLEIGKWRS